MTLFERLMEIAAIQPHERVRYREIADKVMALALAIRKRPVLDQQIVWHLIVGYNQKHVAQELAISQQTVSYRLSLMRPVFARVLETR